MTHLQGRQTASIPLPDPPEGMDPMYANLVRIGHTPAEVTLDFARLLPGDPAARYVARILMSPMGAKMFYRALGDNLARYEAAFGEIRNPAGGPSLADSLFRSPPPPETEE